METVMFDVAPSPKEAATGKSSAKSGGKDFRDLFSIQLGDTTEKLAPGNAPEEADNQNAGAKERAGGKAAAAETEKPVARKSGKTSEELLAQLSVPQLVRVIVRMLDAVKTGAGKEKEQSGAGPVSQKLQESLTALRDALACLEDLQRQTPEARVTVPGSKAIARLLDRLKEGNDATVPQLPKGDTEAADKEMVQLLAAFLEEPESLPQQLQRTINVLAKKVRQQVEQVARGSSVPGQDQDVAAADKPAGPVSSQEMKPANVAWEVVAGTKVTHRHEHKEREKVQSAEKEAGRETAVFRHVKTSNQMSLRSPREDNQTDAAFVISRNELVRGNTREQVSTESRTRLVETLTVHTPQNQNSRVASTELVRSVPPGIRSFQQQIIDQIQQAVKVSFNPPQNEVRIRLMPENLGEVTIKVQLANEAGLQGKHSLTASVLVENEGVKDAIMSNLGQLKSNLQENAGLVVRDISVTVRTGQEFAQQRQAHDHPQGQNFTKSGSFFGGDEENEEFQGVHQEVSLALRGILNYIV